MKKISSILFILFLVSCKTPDARKPVSQRTSTYIQESIKYNKKVVSFQEGLIKEIIKQDTENNYLTSNNGFWYYYNEKNILPAKKPSFGDKVSFSYNLLHLDGSPIYTTEEIGPRTYIIDKQVLFSGLREGLKLMKVGETVTFLFPSHKAFGYYGDQQRIGVNIPIKSTVTLYAIQTDTELKNDSIN